MFANRCKNRKVCKNPHACSCLPPMVLQKLIKKWKAKCHEVGRLLPLEHPLRSVPNNDEIVISGLSGRFPRCDNVLTFGDRLFAGEDLVTEDGFRHPKGLYNVPNRQGMLNDVSKFDANFFQIDREVVPYFDPQLRILLEIVTETMMDAGQNPMELRGKRIGVFVAFSESETRALLLTVDPDNLKGKVLNGCATAMMANQISFQYHLIGTSNSVDSACSSSFSALENALDAIRKGTCSAAIVAAAHVNLMPHGSVEVHAKQMSGKRGACRSYDTFADGYARSEAIVAIFLQRRSDARRIYATVLDVCNNSDGHKTMGINYPLGARRLELMHEVCVRAGIRRCDVFYMEVHGPGTVAGDRQEGEAVTEFSKNRDTPLLIGSVKSNMGHAEPASGLCALAKMIIAVHRGQIPPNLHFEEPNKEIGGLMNGTLKMVTEPTHLPPGSNILVCNNGYGGTNYAAILRTHDPSVDGPRVVHPPAVGVTTTDELPRLVLFWGRTRAALENVFNVVKMHIDDDTLDHLLLLLAMQATFPPHKTTFRGHMIFSKCFPHSNADDRNEDGGQRDGTQPSETCANNAIEERIQEVDAGVEKRPVWFVFSGMGSQHAGMGKALMQIPTFRRSIQSQSEALKEFGVDVGEMLQREDPEVYRNNTQNCMVAITAIQVALVDTLTTMGVQPDGIMGHSTGEMGAGYADGALSARETIRLAYDRGHTIERNKRRVAGAMAAVELSWAQVLARCPDGVVPVCHNGSASVTVSGDADKVKAFVLRLKSEGVTATLVDSSGIQFHSAKMAKVRKQMLKAMRKTIQTPNKFSNKFVSTSVRRRGADAELLCDAEYHVNNACSPVLFAEAVKKILPNAIVIEVAPHGLLQSQLLNDLSASCLLIQLVNKKSVNELRWFLQALGKIYAAGAKIHPERLYEPQPQLPVPLGTPMLSSLMGWEHAESWRVVNYENACNNASSSFVIDPVKQSEQAYLLDHVIDGRPLYPFTGFLLLVWQTLCRRMKVNHQETAVVFKDVTVHCPTGLSNQPVRFEVSVNTELGHFEVVDGDGTLCASGFIFKAAPLERESFACDQLRSSDEENIRLEHEEVYQLLSLMGYDYKRKFKGIYAVDNNGRLGTLHWDGNWVTFLDSFLQTTILANPSKHTFAVDALRLPTHIDFLHIDPVAHHKFLIEGNKVEYWHDVAAHKFVSDGVEFSEPNVSAAKRSQQKNGDLYHEKVVAVMDFDDNVLKHTPKQKRELKKYRVVLYDILYAGLASWRDDNILSSFLTSELAREALWKAIKLNHENICDELREKTLAKPKYIFLRALSEVFDASLRSTSSVDEFKQKVVAKMKQAFSERSRDTYWSAEIDNERLLKVPLNTMGLSSRILVHTDDEHVLVHLIKIGNSEPMYRYDWSYVAEHSAEAEQLGATRVSNAALSAGAKTFDFLVLHRVLFKKPDMRAFLRNCGKWVRDDGLIALVEPTRDHHIMHLFDALLGQPRSFESFEEHDAMLSAENIEQSIGRACEIIYKQSDPDLGTTTLVIKLLPEQQPTTHLLSIDDTAEFGYVEKLKPQIAECGEKHTEQGHTSVICLTSVKNRTNGAIGLAATLKKESADSIQFCVVADLSLEKENREGPAQIQISSAEVQKRIRLGLRMNIMRDGNWCSMRHMLVKNDKLHVHKDEVNHAVLCVKTIKNAFVATWVEAADMSAWASSAQLLCHVYYATLTPAEVARASRNTDASFSSSIGVDGAPPHSPFIDNLGMEFAGRLNDGRRVMGFVRENALATSVLCNAAHMWPIPERWSLGDAATIPVSYAVAFNVLCVQCRVCADDKVLIVGDFGCAFQAAIRVASSLGCRLFVALSSTQERDFLRARFHQQQIDFVDLSAQNDVKQRVLEATDGEGVDFLVNANDAGEDNDCKKERASLRRCLAQSGRVVDFNPVDLFAATPNNSRKINQLVQQGIEHGVVQPFEHRCFRFDNLETAYGSMSEKGVQTKHPDKMLFKVRDDSDEQPVRMKTISAVRRIFCDLKGVYLLVGGAGGFGLQVAHWLITRGARKIVLTNTSGRLSKGYQRRCVKRWREEYGADVVVSKLNVGKREEAFALVDECLRMGPFKGVFNMAMRLNECLFKEQTVQNFQEQAEAKFYGTRYLDEATRALCPELEWFVAFSSVSGGRGNEGQAPYSWANSAMERIVEQRRADGFPGIAIQWGTIGDVGVVFDKLKKQNDKIDNDTTFAGTVPQRMHSCLASLEHFLCWDHPIVSCYTKADSRALRSVTSVTLMDIIARLKKKSVDELKALASLKLNDIGFDSLELTEIKSALANFHNVHMSLDSLRKLNFGELIEISD